MAGTWREKLFRNSPISARTWRPIMSRSHKFRPSYMRLRASLLRARLKAECILAMTATAIATAKALHNVMLLISLLLISSKQPN
nr:ATP-dependent DNA helicase Q-like 5 [Ipomoea batatas]